MVKEDCMKTLIIFYSLEGNTKYIAEIVAKQLQADVLELKPKKVYPSKGFVKYIWGGKSVVFKEQPELLNENVDLSSYENIVIGTPIWAGTYAAPINTFINQYSFSGKNVALFACHAGSGATKCFAKLKEALATNKFVGEIDFINPLKHGKEDIYNNVVQWVLSLGI